MASTTDLGLYMAYIFGVSPSMVMSSYPSYHACASSKFRLYSAQSDLTSSSVNPKNSAISRGLIMEYSLNIFKAECEPYFFIGKIPVIYASAIYS